MSHLFRFILQLTLHFVTFSIKYLSYSVCEVKNQSKVTFSDFAAMAVEVSRSDCPDEFKDRGLIDLNPKVNLMMTQDSKLLNC